MKSRAKSIQPAILMHQEKPSCSQIRALGGRTTSHSAVTSVRTRFILFTVHLIDQDAAEVTTYSFTWECLARVKRPDVISKNTKGLFEEMPGQVKNLGRPGQIFEISQNGQAGQVPVAKSAFTIRDSLVNSILPWSMLRP
nr:hypothetical protein CFP56_21165 [Quercus suber]